MQKKTLLALMLILTMLLSGCSLIVKDDSVDDARVVIRVGDDTYTKAQVQANIDYTLQQYQYIYSLYGLTFDSTDETTISRITDSVIDGLVERSVLIAKAKELGLDELTDEESAQLDEDVKSELETLRESAASSFSLSTETQLEEIEAKLTEYGYTEESIRESLLESLLMEKAEEYAIKDVAVTEEEITAEYNSKVEEAKTSYESDPEAYGKAVLNGDTIYYRPAGYRYVKQILIKFNEEDSALVSEIQSALTTAQSEQTTATAALNDLNVENADDLVAQVTIVAKASETPNTTFEIESTTTSFTEELDEAVSAAVIAVAEANSKVAYLQQQLEAAEALEWANIATEADEVLTALDNGEDWDTLVAEHNDDPGMAEGSEYAETGYQICEGFSSFDSAFVDAAMLLENVGDHTTKIEGSYGYYIIKYVGDVEEGAIDIETVREGIESDTLSAKQETVKTETIAQWVSDANAQINKSILDN